MHSGDPQGYIVSKELEASRFPSPNTLNYKRCLPNRNILFLDYRDFVGKVIKCDKQLSIRTLIMSYIARCIVTCVHWKIQSVTYYRARMCDARNEL